MALDSSLSLVNVCENVRYWAGTTAVVVVVAAAIAATFRAAQRATSWIGAELATATSDRLAAGRKANRNMGILQ